MPLHESLILLFSVLAFHALATRTISEAFGSKSQPCHQSLHFKVLNSRLSNISVCSCVLTIFELSRDGSKLLSFLFVAHNHYFHKFYVSKLVSILCKQACQSQACQHLAIPKGQSLHFTPIVFSVLCYHAHNFRLCFLEGSCS